MDFATGSKQRLNFSKSSKSSFVFIQSCCVNFRSSSVHGSIHSRGIFHGRKIITIGLRRSPFIWRGCEDSQNNHQNEEKVDDSLDQGTFETVEKPQYQEEQIDQTSAGKVTSYQSASAATIRQNSLKQLCATLLLVIISTCGYGYFRLNRLVRNVTQVAFENTISREVHIGRVIRFNPLTGIRVLGFSLPESEKRKTAPVVEAQYADVFFSGIMASVTRRKPLKLNVRLHNATVKVSQMVVDGPNGLPISEWDPGLLPQTSSSPSKKEDLELLGKILKYVQPGTLTVKNADIFLQPADFLDYGHGAEVIEINCANAEATFPTFSINTDAESPIQMDGDFSAKVAGIPVDGGKIECECQCDGSSLPTLKPEDKVVTLRVVGEDVGANHVASFLSLPFRADRGKCEADIDMDFLYRSKSLIPIMRGQAQLSSVGIRFHPDPKTPEFQDISGRLRFEGKNLFFDGPVGSLGTLPMTIVGNIHLEDGYNLIGYASPVDVNNILDTFEVEKFVPIEGQAIGEAHLTGTLEEPIIRGWAQSSSDNSVFDRLPLDSADLSYEWDAIAGILKFTDINAMVKGGGTVRGGGTMYFDMTKESPYDIRRTEHSERNPKSQYWNNAFDDEPTQPIPDLPEDVMEIDEYAAFRSYDSMRFDFKVENVNGGDLLEYYGGVYGAKARLSLGRVSGKGIIAGHLKDANCRAIWKTVSPPPKVYTDDNRKQSSNLSTENESKKNSEDESSKKSGESESSEDKRDKPTETEAEIDETSLSGGEFKGLVYIKLGDLPEARRVKVRTTVKDFDSRRAGWSDPAIQQFLKQFPSMQLNGDSYFKGLMFQRPVIPPGVKKMPRTPRMELLGIDGALAIRKLGLNELKFDDIMTGSFSFSTNDFSMSLKANSKQKKLNSDAKLGYEQTERDEVTMAASLKGEANMTLRRGGSEVVSLFSTDKKGRQTASLLCKDFNVQEILVQSGEFSGGEAISGKVNANLNLDVSRRTGGGNISLENPGLGQLKFNTISGRLTWKDKNLYLDQGLVHFKRSEYQINARYRIPDRLGAAFGWEVDMNIPNANVKDVARLLQSGNAVATSMQSSISDNNQLSKDQSGGPFWIQKLAQSRLSEENLIESWSVPKHLSFPEQMEWYLQYKDEMENIRLQTEKDTNVNRASEAPRLSDITGNISGRITFKYNSSQKDSKQASSTTKLFLKAFLDQLARTSFSFYLIGHDWRVRDVPIREVLASGSFEDGTLDLGPVRVIGKNGAGAVLQGQVTKGGQVEGTARLERAPVGVLDLYHNAPVVIKGLCSGRFDIDGNLSNPRAIGRLIWTKASLNGKKVKGAKTDMACVNGRCALTVNAEVGRQNVNTDESDDEALRSLNWNDTVVQGLYELAAQAEKKVDDSHVSKRKASTSRGNRRDRREVEPIHIHVSAPVRFYLLNYLRSRVPKAFKREVENIMTSSYPFDDEWILMDINVKKYGLALLNIVAPELGWEGGNSDVTLTVSGSLPKPVMKGTVTVSDGHMWPTNVSDPISGLKGSVLFQESGLVSLRSISGKCRGRNINLYGDMFVSQDYRDSNTRSISEYQKLLAATKNSGSRKTRRSLQIQLTEARNALNKAIKGFSLDFGEVPVEVPKIVKTKLSGRLNVKGTIDAPLVSGMITLSDGLVLLSGANSLPKAQVGSRSTSNEGMNSTPQQNVPESLNYFKNKNPDSNIKQTEAKQDVLTNDDQSTETIETQRLPHREKSEICVNNLRVVFGKGMKIAQPFLLNMDTSGSIWFNGNVNNPKIDGEIRLLRGTLNFFASRMKLRPSEANYVKFDSSSAGNDDKSSEKEPMIRMAVENDSVIVKVEECGIREWSKNVSISTKQGHEETKINWNEITRIDMSKVKSRYLLKRLIANHVIDSLSVQGKLSQLEWKVFPAMTTKTGGFGYLNLREEIGAGAQLRLGPISIAGSKLMDGSTSATANVRIFNWLSIRLKLEGDILTSDVTFLPRKKKQEIYEYSEVMRLAEENEESGKDGKKVKKIITEKSVRVITDDDEKEELDNKSGGNSLIDRSEEVNVLGMNKD